MYVGTGLIKGLSCLKSKQTLKSGRYLSNMSKNMEKRGKSLYYRNMMKMNPSIRMLSYAASSIFALYNKNLQLYSFIIEILARTLFQAELFQQIPKECHKINHQFYYQEMSFLISMFCVFILS